MTNTYNQAGFTYNDGLSTYNTLVSPSRNSTTFRADMQFAGVWTNLTSDVYTAEQVSIKRGRTDESSSPEAATLDLTFNNRTGKYTPSNPAGSLYGLIGRQTPIRVGMGVPPSGAGAFTTASQGSFPAPSILAEQAGIVCSSWIVHAAGGGTFSLPLGYTADGSFAGAYACSVSGHKATIAGTFPASTAGYTANGTWCGGQVCIPGATSVVTQTSGCGKGNGTSLSPTVNSVSLGSFTLLAGDVIVVANGWSGDFGNNLSSAPQDNSGGCSWSLIADTGYLPNDLTTPRMLFWAFYSDSAQTITVTAPSHYYFIDDNFAQAWQLRGASEWNPRFQGECATFNTTADLSDNDVRTAIEAGSVLRQRGQGQESPHSAFFRYLSNSQALAYWPIEGAASGALTSPIVGNTQAQIVGPAASFASQAVPGSDSIVTLAANSYLAATPPPLFGTGANVQSAISCVFQIDTAPTGSPSFLSAWCGGSSGAFVTLQYVTGSSHFNIVVYNSAGTTLLVSSVAPTLPSGVSTYLGRPLACTIAWAPNLANPSTQVDIQVALVDMLTPASQNFWTINANAFTIGAVSTIFFGTTPFPQTLFNVPVSVGHISYTNSARIDGAIPLLNDVFQTAAAYSGISTAWAGEEACLRMTRICQEQSIQFQSRPPSVQTSAVQMGAQLTNDTISLLEECQETDGEGELFEARGFGGLSYRSIGEISGGASQASLDFNAKQITSPFNQVDDDQLTRNSVTVQQNGGTSQLVEQTSGPLNTAPPPTGVGLFTGNPTVNVVNQGRDLQQLGNWFVAVGTTQAPRFPAVTSQLAASQSTISNSSSVDCGQRFTVLNPPTWCPPGPIELVALGFNERISATPGSDWDITINARPYAPFRVINLANATTQPAPTATLDSGSSTLTSNITSAATSLSATVGLTEDLWSLTPGYDIVIDGERMTVTGVSGTSSPQTLTVTRAVNGIVVAHLAGAAIHVYYSDLLGITGT